MIGTRTVADVQAALKGYADAHPDVPVIFGIPSALNTQKNVAGVAGRIVRIWTRWLPSGQCC